MVVANRFFNNISTEYPGQGLAERYLPNWSRLSTLESNSDGSDLVAGEDFYQQIESFSDTIISLQYTPDEFLTFRVCNADQGQIWQLGTRVTGLRCRIGDTFYTFNREHLSMMSNRERQELFNQLGVDGSQLLQD